MATPTETIAFLQQHNSTVDPGLKCPTAFPPSLLKRNLPCVLVFPMRGASRKLSRDVAMTERIYDVSVYLQLVGEEWEMDAAIKESDRLIPLFQELYLFNPRLNSTSHYPRINASPIEDTGVSILGYGPDDFHGFRFYINVIDLVQKA